MGRIVPFPLTACIVVFAATLWTTRPAVSDDFRRVYDWAELSERESRFDRRPARARSPVRRSDRSQFLAKRPPQRPQRVVIQPIAPRPGRPAEPALVLADRRMIARLNRAKDLIGKKKFRDAIEYLQFILDSPEDGFFAPDPENKLLLRSLKIEVQNLIGNISKSSKQSPYELQFGTTARHMLTAALEQGDSVGLAEVVRRYFHTAAGYEAAYRMGSYHFDHSRYLAAALCFERLKRLPQTARKWEPLLSLRTAVCWNRAGNQDKAKQILLDLKAAADSNVITLGGVEIALFERSDKGLQWLHEIFGQPASIIHQADRSDWALFGGNSARNPVGSFGGVPAGIQWQLATVFDPTKEDPTDTAETDDGKYLKKTVRDLNEAIQKQSRAVLPRSHPIVVGNTVFVRTIGNITAIDLETGKPKWPTMHDLTLGALLERSQDGTAPANRQRYLELLLSQRIWSDSTNGTLSSDGKFLYAVEEVGFGMRLYDSTIRRTIEPRSDNTLVAYHLDKVSGEGKRAWSVGGAKGDPLFEEPLAGTFFLGAPLPLAGKLYCLADQGGEIRLLVLDAKNQGRLVWSQPLAAAGNSITNDRHRRTAGTAASYADGVMVCPTDAGTVVAVDLTNRSLLWAHRFRQTAAKPPIIRRRRIPQRAPSNAWVSSRAVISNGKVLLTPWMSNELHCIDLLDGSLIWKKPQADGLYVAGVTDGKVLVVGKNSVQAWKLSSGAPAWAKPAVVDTPCGLGLVVDRFLYVPTTANELAVIDVKSGKTMAAVKSPQGRPLGNLIHAGGTVISQGVDSVTAFALPSVEKTVSSR